MVTPGGAPLSGSSRRAGQHPLQEANRSPSSKRGATMSTLQMQKEDTGVQPTLALLEELLGDYAPRDFAVHLWDGTTWEPAPGQPAVGSQPSLEANTSTSSGAVTKVGMQTPSTARVMAA